MLSMNTPEHSTVGPYIKDLSLLISWLQTRMELNIFPIMYKQREY